MSNLKRLLENLLLTEGYYADAGSVHDVISRWQKAGDKLYDDAQPVMLPTEDIFPFREFDRSREGGRNSPEEWDQIVSWMKATGWDPKKPLHMLIGKEGGAKVGEGNHRLAIAKQLGIKTIPVQFHFVWDKVVKDKLPTYREGRRVAAGNKIWFAGSPSQEVKRLSNDIVKAHKSASHQLVCKELAKRLNRAGLDVEIHHGTYCKGGHTWLVVEGSIVDPTANRFDDYPNMDEYEYVDHEVETLWENKYPGLNEAQEETQEYYHCTPAKNIVSIMKHGLMPGDGENFGNHDWSEGKIFVSRGYEQAKSWQEVIAEMTMEDVAILHLKLSPFQIENLYTDEVAHEQDGNEESFYTLDSIPPNQIEIVDKGEGPLDNFLSEGTEEPEDYRGGHQAPGKEGSAPLWDVSQGIYPDDIYTLPASTAARYYGAGERDDGAVMGLIQRLHNKPKAAVKIFRAVPKAKSLATKIAEFEAKKREHLRRGKLPSPNDMSPQEARAAQSGKSAWYDWVSNEIEALQKQLAKYGEPAGLDIKTINPGDWITIWRPYAAQHGNSALNGEYKILTKTVPASTLYTDGNSMYEFGYNP